MIRKIFFLEMKSEINSCLFTVRMNYRIGYHVHLLISIYFPIFVLTPPFYVSQFSALQFYVRFFFFVPYRRDWSVPKLANFHAFVWLQPSSLLKLFQLQWGLPVIRLRVVIGYSWLFNTYISAISHSTCASIYKLYPDNGRRTCFRNVDNVQQLFWLGVCQKRTCDVDIFLSLLIIFMRY